MPNRSWFFAADGKQQGPYPEEQFRDFIAQGMITSETLVWTEGMAGWQKAGEIRGLLYSAGAPPPVRAGEGMIGAGSQSGGPLSIDVGIWSLLGRCLLYVIGLVLVIPAPWAATSFFRFIVSRMVVPGRPNLAFTGRVGDLWYAFVILGLCSYAGLSDNYGVRLIVIPIEAFLSWMILQWLVGNLSSNGQNLPIAFTGSPLGYIGWYLLLYISFITIIGWAWVTTAWMRWICRNISGTHREITFNATGWSVLWRTLLFALGCAFLIPIPWVLGWYARWYVSQFALIEKGAS